MLTTHPYPLFTPHCNREPMNTMRPLLHGTAEVLPLRRPGRQPAFIEEFGNLGPMVCGEETTADYVRGAVVSAWAHDCRGALWWCAHDQTELDFAPYDWVAVERSLACSEWIERQSR